MQNGSVIGQWKSIGVVWLLAVVGAVLTGLLSAPGQALSWVGLTLGGCTLATLSLQLATGRKEGYVTRVTWSIVGAVIVLGIATVIFAFTGLR